ncbi:Assembly factor cbp4 [Ciborinia camelliae]|nr:Assembly factor cbp4 [Ciborinia camelliae]
MPPKPTNWRMYGKMAVAGLTCCVGGPALVYYVSPTEEELFLRYNPELQKRSLENRVGKQEDFDNFVSRLKEYSKSDRPIWVEAEEAARKSRSGKIEEQAKLMQEMQQRKEDIKKSGTKLIPGGSL